MLWTDLAGWSGCPSFERSYHPLPPTATHCQPLPPTTANYNDQLQLQTTTTNYNYKLQLPLLPLQLPAEGRSWR